MDFLIWPLQIVSLITTLVGIYFIAKKIRFGFVCYIVSLLCQGALFSMRNDWVLVFQMLVLITCNFYAFNEWKKGDTKNET